MEQQKKQIHVNKYSQAEYANHSKEYVWQKGTD